MKYKLIKVLVIRCLNCKGTWEETELPFTIYEYITCPHCKKVVEADIIDLKIKRSYVRS